MVEFSSLINEKFRDRAWLDFELSILKDGRVSIVGSNDLTYYHEVEIMFQPLEEIKSTSWHTTPDASGWIIQSELVSVNRYRLKFNTDDGLLVFFVSDIQYNLDFIKY